MGYTEALIGTTVFYGLLLSPSLSNGCGNLDLDDGI